jgi:riboflavin kinase/FMN adenylyltransferase
VDGIADKPLEGVASLGVRPTVSERPQAGAGSLHLRFPGRHLRAHLRVNFLHKLRDEAKFDSLEALTAQIARDVVAMRATLRARRTN